MTQADLLISAPQLQEFQKASEMLTHTPEVRETKIMALRREVEHGHYRIKAEQVAAMLMQEQLRDLCDCSAAPAKVPPVPHNLHQISDPTFT